MNVLVVDLGSRMNAMGGQARIAASLFRGLGKRFNTYYLGYPTEYLSGGRNTIMLSRGKMLGLGLKRSRASEHAIMRMGYNLIVARNLVGLGMDKAELLERVRRMRPDVIIANSVGDLPLLIYLRKRGIAFKSIYVDHGSISGTAGRYFSKESIPLVFGTGVNALSTRGALRKFFGFFDATVALSRKQFADIFRFTRDVAYIPNGISVVRGKDAGLERGLRKRLGIGRRDFVVLYIGRLFERQKSVSTLIRAFARLRHRDMRLLIVGDGPSRSEYEGLADGDRRIVFAGMLDDRLVPYAYGISDLYVLPSNWEGFSLTLLEAAAHSLPIIVSDSVDCAEYRTGGKGLMTFRTGDPESLARRLEQAYRSVPTQRSMREVSGALARKYSEGRMLDAYAKLITSVAGK